MGILLGVPASMNMSAMDDELAAASDVDRMFHVMTLPHHAAALLMAHEELRFRANEATASVEPVDHLLAGVGHREMQCLRDD